MNSNHRTKKIINDISILCENYLEKKIDIKEFQETLSAFSTNFENDISLWIQKIVNNFIEDLEYIQHMFSKNEQYEAVVQKIKEIKKLITDSAR